MYYVYILTNWNNKVLYTGMTGNLKRRISEHKNHTVDGFTKKYNVDKLVFYKETNDVNTAIILEKRIKGWTREKKISLIESVNPEWKDLME